MDNILSVIEDAPQEVAMRIAGQAKAPPCGYSYCLTTLRNAVRCPTRRAAGISQYFGDVLRAVHIAAIEVRVLFGDFVGDFGEGLGRSDADAVDSTN